MKTILAAIIFLLATLPASSQTKLQTAFTIKEKDLIPEGIAYNPQDRSFYLSSINKNKIVKITSTGHVSDFSVVGDSLLQVLGMNVDNSGRLWACNNSPEHDTVNRMAKIHVYDLKSRKVVKVYRISDGSKHLFNDVYINKNGEAYITDSDAGAVYKVTVDGNLEEFVKPGSLRYPNGITASDDEKTLYVSAAGMGIVALDIGSRKFQTISHPKYYIIGTDGLYRYKNSLIGVQNVTYPEGIMQYTFSGDRKSFADLKFIATGDAKFDTPTTGVIVGEEFYFIANSQLLQLIGNQGKIKSPETLTDTYIMKIRLD
jgi:DNA-binding beta-propeller fold protein YncE